MKQISIKLTEPQVKAIEEYANELGVNFSVALRLLLTRSLSDIKSSQDFLKGLSK